MFDTKFIERLDNLYANSKGKFQDDVKDTLLFFLEKTNKDVLYEFNLPIGYAKNNVLQKLSSQKIYVIEEPFGTQKSPDFLICYNDKALEVEAKSMQLPTKTIMWNDGLPVKN